MLRKVLTIIVACVLIFGIGFGIYYMISGNDTRFVRCDEDLKKSIVTVIGQEEDAEEKDILDVRTVKVGDTVKINYNGEVFIGAKKDAPEDFVGMTITGVKLVENNTYVVVDNIRIDFVQEVAPAVV